MSWSSRVFFYFYSNRIFILFSMTDVTLFCFALVCSTSFLSKIIFSKIKSFFYFDISVPTFDVDVRVIEWKDQNFMKHDFSILNFSTFVFFVSVKKWPNTETEERERFPVKRKSIRLHRKKVFFRDRWETFFPLFFCILVITSS